MNNNTCKITSAEQPTDLIISNVSNAKITRSLKYMIRYEVLTILPQIRFLIDV